MEVTNEIAIRLADMYIEKTNSLCNLHYIVVDYDKNKGGYYADDKTLCPNDKESEKIKLIEGEFLVKAYNKKSKNESKVLRKSDFNN